jgi:hypothetical protein
VLTRAATIGMVVAGSALASSPACAQESPGSFERVLWTGPTAGAPSQQKRVVLSGLYVLSAASLGATGYFAYSWVRAADQVSANDVRGVCFELASRDCHRFMDAQADLRGAQRGTAAAAAATAGFLLGGMLVARHWANGGVGVAVSPGAAFVRLTTSF